MQLEEYPLARGATSGVTALGVPWMYTEVGHIEYDSYHIMLYEQR